MNLLEPKMTPSASYYGCGWIDHRKRAFHRSRTRLTEPPIKAALMIRQIRPLAVYTTAEPEVKYVKTRVRLSADRKPSARRLVE